MKARSLLSLHSLAGVKFEVASRSFARRRVVTITLFTQVVWLRPNTALQRITYTFRRMIARRFVDRGGTKGLKYIRKRI